MRVGPKVSCYILIRTSVRNGTVKSPLNWFPELREVPSGSISLARSDSRKHDVLSSFFSPVKDAFPEYKPSAGKVILGLEATYGRVCPRRTGN